MWEDCIDWEASEIRRTKPKRPAKSVHRKWRSQRSDGTPLSCYAARLIRLFFLVFFFFFLKHVSLKAGSGNSRSRRGLFSLLIVKLIPVSSKALILFLSFVSLHHRSSWCVVPCQNYRERQRLHSWVTFSAGWYLCFPFAYAHSYGNSYRNRVNMQQSARAVCHWWRNIAKYFRLLHLSPLDVRSDTLSTCGEYHKTIKISLSTSLDSSNSTKLKFEDFNGIFFFLWRYRSFSFSYFCCKEWGTDAQRYTFVIVSTELLHNA